jgi:hypothetical protein
MSRYEMKMKRCEYSKHVGVVVSVWNKGKIKSESKLPWTVFKQGKEVTSDVVTVPTPSYFMMGTYTLE